MEIEQGDDQQPGFSKRDELTGTLNRQAIEGVLSNAIKRAQLGSEIVAVSYIDINSLNVINDQFGHAVGDMVLRQAADALQSAFGTDSEVGRVGDDEFLVVSIGIPLEELVELAESARRSAARAFDLGNMVPASAVDSSIGVSLYRDEFRTADELIEAAYKAMYLGKQFRRNQDNGQ